ncbi:MAG TPA: CHAT domain-containing tetratricopeptide repeat protein [Pyrinomonadaceae bacterium]|nr:CHAT domain-containing tetratricopeptide repeat protein [Pyrinomonadaceae bacterium]
MKSTSARLITLLATSALLCNLTAAPIVARSTQQPSQTQQQSDQAATALREGRQLLKRGQSDQALVQLQKALSLYTAAKNNRGIAATHNELGDLYLRQGQHTVALDHYQKALDGFIGAQAKQDVVTAAIGVADDKFNANLMLAKIGDVNFRLGKYNEARAAYGRMEAKKPESAAAKVGRRFGGFGAIVGGISTGNVSVAAPTSALTVALEAKKELDEYRVSIVYASYQLGMGRLAYFNNELEPAKKNFQNALDAAGSSLAFLAGLGQTRRFRAAARTSLGDVALRQGKFKDATKFYTEAVKGAQDDKRLDLMWPAQRGLGRGLWLQAEQEKNPKKAESMMESAIGNYRNALSTIETLRQGSLRADEARTTFLASTKDVFDEAVAGLAEMALRSSSATGTPLTGKSLEYAAEAFKINEQSRARSLLDLLNESGGSITEGVPVELLKRKQENLSRQQEIAEVLTGINISTAEQKKKPGELETELETLQTEFDQIENQIRTSSPRYAQLTASQPLSLTEVQQKVLDDSTVLMAYSLGTDASYLWAVSREAVALHKLPARPELDKLATEMRAQLIPSKLQRRIVGIDVVDPARGLGISSTPHGDGAAAFIAASHALYKAVIEPAAPMVAENRILVVADGALNYVPFEALVKSATPGDYSTLDYLIKTNEVAYAPSASVIGAIRAQGSRTVGKGLLVVADPVFNSLDTRARGVSSTTQADAGTRGLGLQSALADVAGSPASGPAGTEKMQGLPLSRLAGTRAEAEEIAKLAKQSGAHTDLWLDLDAAEENFEARDLKNYRVVHIATHGLLNAERPQFTGLVLSLIGNKRGDGFLRTDEVFNLRLGSPLVMLSACETGLGKERRGEGVLGLTRAFMYAGAPTVGVSLWSVADKSTADLMSDFYKRLLVPGTQQQLSPSAAMRAAQLQMIGAKKYSAPFYWAPFVLIGDWQQG